MPAYALDIIRATRQARVVTREDADLKLPFPNARDAADSPEPGYFESALDAAKALALKAALVSMFHRRFLVTIADEMWIDPLAGVPTGRLIDFEHGVDTAALLTRVEIDMNEETCRVEVLG